MPPSELQTYCSQIEGFPRLTRSEESSLHKAYTDGDESAKQRYIEANLRLVITIARDFMGFGIAIEDLVAEGNTGLIRAVELYCPRRGVPFSAYARNWVRHKMFRALASQSRLIRLPAHVIDRIRRLGYLLKDDEEISDADLSDKIGVRESEIKLLKEYRDRTEVSLLDSVELSDYEDSEGVGGWMDIVDTSAVDPYKSLEVADEVRHLSQVRKLVLTSREHRVIEGRFPLDGSEPKSLERIGSELVPKLTRERVRQVQNEALRKLRHAMVR